MLAQQRQQLLLLLAQVLLAQVAKAGQGGLLGGRGRHGTRGGHGWVGVEQAGGRRQACVCSSAAGSHATPGAPCGQQRALPRPTAAPTKRGRAHRRSLRARRRLGSGRLAGQQRLHLPLQPLQKVLQSQFVGGRVRWCEGSVDVAGGSVSADTAGQCLVAGATHQQLLVVRGHLVGHGAARRHEGHHELCGTGGGSGVGSCGGMAAAGTGLARMGAKVWHAAAACAGVHTRRVFWKAHARLQP